MSAESRRRIARKAHRCDGCARTNIKPGDAYLTRTVFPGSDYSDWDIPCRFKECAFCADRYSRGHLLEPMPAEQGHAVYLQAMQEGRG